MFSCAASDYQGPFLLFRLEIRALATGPVYPAINPFSPSGLLPLRSSRYLRSQLGAWPPRYLPLRVDPREGDGSRRKDHVESCPANRQHSIIGGSRERNSIIFSSSIIICSADVRVVANNTRWALQRHYLWCSHDILWRAKKYTKMTSQWPLDSSFLVWEAKWRHVCLEVCFKAEYFTLNSHGLWIVIWKLHVFSSCGTQ